jgi:hypothetical protein
MAGPPASNVPYGRAPAQGRASRFGSRGLDRARAVPYTRALVRPGALMPRSKSKRKILRHRWKVKRKNRLERKKAAQREERGR